MDSITLAQACREYADNRKAENIVVLDMRSVSTITDFFVIASGTSEPHLRAIADEVETKVRENFGVRPRAVDGSVQGAWLVLDYFDVIVHIMRTDAREKYDIEGLWNDAPKVDKELPKAEKPKKRAAKKVTASPAKPKQATKKKAARKSAA